MSYRDTYEKWLASPALSPEEKAGEEEYRRRLDVCQECEKLQNGMCLSCGCFVQVRAAKGKERCPWEKW